jgi:hypothetical protein
MIKTFNIYHNKKKDDTLIIELPRNNLIIGPIGHIKETYETPTRKQTVNFTEFIP